MSPRRIAFVIATAAAVVAIVEVACEQTPKGNAKEAVSSQAAAHEPVLHCTSPCDIGSLFRHPR